MKFPVYNLAAEKIKDIELSSRIFGVSVKPEVVHQVVVAQEANARQPIADTKTRGEVRGGGKKPWRQKGTGRARQGSIRSPQWKGGGVVFGPTSERNFSKRVNKKQKQLALAMCLTDKAANKSMAIFDDIKFDNGKTKELNSWIKGLKTKLAEVKDGKKFLLVLAKNDAQTVLAALNLTNVNVIQADSLNCRALLLADKVLVAEKAIDKIESHYKKIKESKKA